MPVRRGAAMPKTTDWRETTDRCGILPPLRFPSRFFSSEYFGGRLKKATATSFLVLKINYIAQLWQLSNPLRGVSSQWFTSLPT